MDLLRLDFIYSAKMKIDAKYNCIKPSFDESDISRLIFRGEIDAKNKDVMAAHVQSIKTQLDRVLLERDFKTKEMVLEFSKSVTLFDKFTGALEIEGGVFGDNYIRSKSFYLDAVSACKSAVPNFYQGSMEFSCIPIKLRLAIEVYFKNMIGYVKSSQEFLTGKRKGELAPYPLSIADLLNFFSNKKYKKYCNLPIDIKILKDINFWSNNLVHTGVISFAWQNLQAIELLSRLFQTEHKNGSIDIWGFNYLSSEFDHDDLERDLNGFLSSHLRKVKVECSRFSGKLIEGGFYHSRK